MPKSRRVSKSKSKSLWAKIAAMFVFLFVGLFVLSSHSQSNVLGVSTSNLFGFTRPNVSITPEATSKCQPMVSAISLSSVCQAKNGQYGFKTVSFTCADGTTKSSTKNCLSPQQAIETAGKTCSKGSNCKPPVNPGGLKTNGQGGQQSGQSQQGGMMQGGQQPQNENSTSF